MGGIFSVFQAYPAVGGITILIILIIIGIIISDYFFETGIFFGKAAGAAGKSEDVGSALNGAARPCDATMCAKTICKDLAVCTSSTAAAAGTATAGTATASGGFLGSARALFNSMTGSTSTAASGTTTATGTTPATTTTTGTTPATTATGTTPATTATGTTPATTATGTTTATVKTVKEAFAVSAPSDELFIDMQPPAIAHAGLDTSTSFNVKTAIIAALNGGIRAFTLQIDMLDIDKPGGAFAPRNEPTLLLRSPNGALISTNSGSIQEVADAIANAGFTDVLMNKYEPIVLYLHIVRAPDQISMPGPYKAFLGKIAKALAPLGPRHLGSNSLGIFHRQLQEKNILTMPLKTFEGQVIILSNADTSVFKGATSTVAPAEDLDYWVNMRVYALDTADKNIGVAQKYPEGAEGSPAALVTSLESILKLSEKDALAFGLAGKTRYMIAVPSENPTNKDLETAVNRLGVNIVPVDYLIKTPADAVETMKIYKNMAWPEKTAALKSNNTPVSE